MGFQAEGWHQHRHVHAAVDIANAMLASQHDEYTRGTLDALRWLASGPRRKAIADRSELLEARLWWNSHQRLVRSVDNGTVAVADGANGTMPAAVFAQATGTARELQRFHGPTLDAPFSDYERGWVSVLRWMFGHDFGFLQVLVTHVGCPLFPSRVAHAHRLATNANGELVCADDLSTTGGGL